jgi:imidazolonepropionase-like amidohydrolase
MLAKIKYLFALFMFVAFAADAAPVGDLAIVGARIYPAPGAAVIDDGTVLVRDGRIVAVGPRDRVAVRPGTPTVDGHGAVVTAGFWNSHVHLLVPDMSKASTKPAPALEGVFAAMLTRWGFTTIFDLASEMNNTLTLRRRIEAGDFAGPMILTVGDPFFPEGGTPIYVRDFLKANDFPDEEVKTPAEASARAARELAAGTDGVKIFAGAIVGGTVGVLPMRVDVAKAAVDEAHKRGKPAFAHPTNRAGTNVAIESGVDVLAHTTEDGEWPPDLIATLLSHHMALIPTLTLWGVEYRRGGNTDPAPLAAWVDAATGQVRAYAAAGGQILFGTDVGYTDAFDTTEEYRLMAKALDWQAILASLTTAPAERFGFAAHKGRIAVGMDADLVMLDADPAMDPTAFARVRATIRGGRVIWRRP